MIGKGNTSCSKYIGFLGVHSKCAFSSGTGDTSQRLCLSSFKIKRSTFCGLACGEMLSFFCLFYFGIQYHIIGV